MKFNISVERCQNKDEEERRTRKSAGNEAKKISGKKDEAIEKSL